MNTLNAANGISGNLAQVLFDGQKAMSDQALKATQVAAQTKLAQQQQDVAFAALNMMMGGKGTQVNTIA